MWGHHGYGGGDGAYPGGNGDAHKHADTDTLLYATAMGGDAIPDTNVVRWVWVRANAGRTIAIRGIFATDYEESVDGDIGAVRGRPAPVAQIGGAFAPLLRS